MKVSVVISTCHPKRYDTLVGLLDRIGRQTYGDLEVIIVVDENRPLYEKICEYQKANDRRSILSVKFNPVDYGLSHSRNTGIGYAAGEIVAFIDDDAYPEPDWVSEIASTFAESDLYGAVVGDVDPLWENDDMRWFPRELNWMLSCSYSLTPADKCEIERGFGANMAFRKSLLIRTGLFNTGLGITGKRWVGGEDTEMLFKVRDYGYKVIYSPKAKVCHVIDREKLSIRNIIRRPYNCGYTVAMLRKIRGYRPKSSTEGRYLKSLVFGFYPRSIRALFGRSPGITMKRMACVAIVIVLEMSGYVSGLATIRLNGKTNLDVVRTETDTDAI